MSENDNIKDESVNEFTDVEQQVLDIVQYFSSSLEQNGFSISVDIFNNSYTICLVCPPMRGVSLCSAVAYDIISTIKCNVNVTESESMSIEVYFYIDNIKVTMS